MAKEEALTIDVAAPLLLRLKTYAAINRTPVKRIVAEALATTLPSARELARLLCESETAS